MGRVRLRLARFGSRNRPFYRIVAVDSRRKRDGMPLEYIGTYDPLPSYKDGVKEVRMKVDRVKYWLSVGAQPSDVVGFLLWKSGLMPAPPITPQTKKRIPRQQREFSTLARAQESHDLTVGRDSDQWTMTETTTAQHRRNATDAMQTDTYRVRLAGTYFTLRNVFQPRQQQTLQRM